MFKGRGMRLHSLVGGVVENLGTCFKTPTGSGGPICCQCLERGQDFRRLAAQNTREGSTCRWEPPLPKWVRSSRASRLVGATWAAIPGVPADSATDL